jgi:hypothetical protein
MPSDIRLVDQVVLRTLCLAAVIVRAEAENLVVSHNSEPGFSAFLGGEPEEVPKIIQGWIDKEHLGPHLSPKERIMIAKRAGELTRQEMLDGWWRREALTVLEWSLRIIEPMPAADTQIPMEDVLESAWLLKDTSSFRKAAALRSTEEISSQRDTAEFWLWRVRTTTLMSYSTEDLVKHRTSKDKLRTIADHAAATAEANGLFKCINGDFPAFGKAFRELNDKELRLITSISMERLHGLNWLCVIDGLDWDDVETNT